MADETPTGETPTPDSPKNEPSNPTTPPVDNGSAAEVEQAKKDAEQARMRANQLENENKQLKANQAEADKKQLEEKEEFKALYEKTDAELKQIRDERETAERQTKLSSETETVFKDYPESVVDVAKTAGLSLAEDSETARTALKEKLEAIKAKVEPNGKPPVSPNNPNNPAPANPDREALVKDMRERGAVGDDTAAYKYISQLDSVKRMKEIAGVPPQE
jgi:hypothetical protein